MNEWISKKVWLTLKSTISLDPKKQKFNHLIVSIIVQSRMGERLPHHSNTKKYQRENFYSIKWSFIKLICAINIWIEWDRYKTINVITRWYICLALSWKIWPWKEIFMCFVFKWHYIPRKQPLCFQPYDEIQVLFEHFATQKKHKTRPYRKHTNPRPLLPNKCAKSQK